MEIYAQIAEDLKNSKSKQVLALVESALADGLPAQDILERGLLAGMGIIGDLFREGKIFIPMVMLAAKTMNTAVEMLRPHLISAGVEPKGKVCIGTVKGDQHDIGKNLVKMMMEGAGLIVIDLGTNVAPDTFVSTAISEHCDIIACSALLTTTMPVMKAVVEACGAAGIRDSVRIMVGGAPVTQQFCDQIGADGYSQDAASAASMAVRFCENKR